MDLIVLDPGHCLSCYFVPFVFNILLTLRYACLISSYFGIELRQGLCHKTLTKVIANYAVIFVSIFPF